jgi:DNA-binding NtrC family response regulator
MQASANASSSEQRTRMRTAVIASADRSFRHRLSETLTGLRWRVDEAAGGAEAWAAAAQAAPEAIIVDSWLPDIELNEFLKDFSESYPYVELLTTNTHHGQSGSGTRSPYRQELLYALRRCQDADTSSWNSDSAKAVEHSTDIAANSATTATTTTKPVSDENFHVHTVDIALSAEPETKLAAPQIPQSERLPELVGNSQRILEVSRRIRLVAPRITPVLIEGPTGSGKEIVAEGVHRLSNRSRKPFVAINCAAIPEALLEAELFGHTRGAFTGAVQGRVGRIESADGGTLFLDEIGEMPLALQSKLLRFVESGELQRVGDNERVKVDVRIIAATHQPLNEQAKAGNFRPDLYYRLAVFLIHTPPLKEHLEDLPLLVAHFLESMSREMPVKRIDPLAIDRLMAHDWPGNVRELEHVLERAAILAGDTTTITAREIDFGLMQS